MYGAGSDTTAAAISIAVMAAACYPEVQRWVQEELDQALGKGRGAFYHYLTTRSSFHLESL
jgi:cytochrome P450